MKEKHYYDQPLYAIFRRLNGKLYGYVEDSFSMGWSETDVRIWPKGHIQYYSKRKDEFSLFTDRDFFVVRIKSKKCLVDIILDEITPRMKKYEFRNKRFKEKLTTDSK